LYYRARYFDNAGNLISTSPLSALAVRGSGQTIVVPPPTQDTQPPTAPTNLTATAVSSSQINLSWSASTDNVAVAGYRLERCQGSGCTNFTQIATPNTTSYSDNNLLSNTSYSYRVKAVDTSGNQSAYSNIASATTPAGTADTQPPTVSITSPLNGATVSGVITVSAVATDNVGVAGVQFKLDGVNLGNEILNAPYSVQWDTTKTNNGGHTLTAVARDSGGNIATSSIGVNVSNPTSGGGGGGGIVGIPQTIIVSLSALPQRGPVPLTSIIQASVSGTAVGPINYTFYCNRHDSKTNITPDYNFKLDNSSLTIATTTCIYSSPGNYVAKVIVERGSATPVEQRITITVSSSYQPPRKTTLEQSPVTTTSIEQVRKPLSPQQKSVIISAISSVLQETTNIIQSTARLDSTSRRAILTQIQNLIMLISNLLLQLQKI
jgi:chitodextrinase